MELETKSYNQIIESDSLASFQEAIGIPAKYENWVKGRGAHMAPVLVTRLGELMKMDKDDVLINSIQTAIHFHKALGEDYSIVDPGDNETLQGKSIFLYRNSEDIEKEFLDVPDVSLIANPNSMKTLGKEILHPEAVSIKTVVDLLDSNSIYGIPTAIGALATSREELERVIGLFKEAGKGCIFKDPGGTDGNGITRDIEKIEKYPVVVEEMLDIEKTISVQYLNGTLGVMQENPKDKESGIENDRRWRGNTLPFKNGGMEKLLIGYAEMFATYLEKLTGKKPVIFGMDFAVCKDQNGHERIVFIDPNIRMPGNMYVYYQKALLEKAGYEVPFIQTSLLYEDEVPKLSGSILQKLLDEKGIGIIKYDENKNPKSIRTDENGHPYGILSIVQDPGSVATETSKENNLSMVSVFANSESEMRELVDKMKNYDL